LKLYRWADIAATRNKARIEPRRHGLITMVLIGRFAEKLERGFPRGDAEPLRQAQRTYLENGGPASSGVGRPEADQ
jgi:hypothetical protein